MFMSPRTRIALTAEPGCKRLRLLVVADRACAHHRHDAGGGEILGEQAQGFWLNPLNTRGVSIGFSRFA